MLPEVSRMTEEPAGKRRFATSFRLTPEAERLLRLLEAHMGIKRGAIIELAIRAFAKQHGIEPQPARVEE